MNTVHSQQEQDEPIGIVISRGSRAEPPSVFLAYEWGPAPELEPGAAVVKAA